MNKRFMGCHGLTNVNKPENHREGERERERERRERERDEFPVPSCLNVDFLVEEPYYFCHSLESCGFPP